ncbi:MAG: LacI family DNA-binding transcriptional regulator [Pseudomonadota bacterium]
MAESARITSHDVARLAGVSQSAVSRVFSGASASKATIAKVRAAAEQLGYRPNPLARAMITGKSRIIGLLVAYLDNQFYPVALERLSKALQDRGYHVLVFTGTTLSDAPDALIQDLLDYQVDGIITASVSISSALAKRCADAGIPVVLFNRGQDSAALSSVTSQNAAGGRAVAEFLVAGGHRRIAQIAGWQGSSTGRDRARGFRDGLAALGVTPVAETDGMYDRAAAAQAARVLMEAPAPPDALFVGNDHMAFAVIDMLRGALGLDVPGAVSVVGFDDVPMAAWGAYDLTTVRQPLEQMIDHTVATLLRQIDDPGHATERIVLETSLIVRGSARIPQGWTR